MMRYASGSLALCACMLLFACMSTYAAPDASQLQGNGALDRAAEADILKHRIQRVPLETVYRARNLLGDELLTLQYNLRDHDGQSAGFEGVLGRRHLRDTSEPGVLRRRLGSIGYQPYFVV